VGARSRRSREPTTRPQGRHFLPPWLAAELAQAFEIRGDELVVEVGAGTGRLTRELARVAGLVLAVELDPVLAARLVRAAIRWPNVYVRHDDALATALPTCPFRLVGNIPFGITTALLRRITAVPSATRLDLITQYEAARKRASERGSVMSVVWGPTWHFDLRRRLPARSFHPAPRVDAAWLVAERRVRPLLHTTHIPAFERFVRRGFRSAATPIARTLSIARGDLRAAHVNPGTRAIDLSVHEWVALYQRTVNDRT
jgi:23S rRNA (adenine-N6)-dimethyltransferase